MTSVKSDDKGNCCAFNPDGFEKRLEAIQKAMFCSDGTRTWSADNKRLFSVCYWSLLKQTLSKETSATGKRLNQRQLSVLITSGKKGIKTDPNFIAKLIGRNTFPSDELASRIDVCFSSGQMKRDDIIPRFLSLSKETRYSILVPFIAEEKRRVSDVFKEIEEKIRTLNEFQLFELRGYLARMTEKPGEH